MKEITIKIASKKYNVKLAQTEEQKEKGLQGVESLSDNEGMLFVFDEPEDISF
jgi:uncharacterized membrane protein (UPF0127 family)